MVPQPDLPLDDVIAAASRADVFEAMRELYAEADRTIAEKNATCWNKGECCRFGQYGHRLYVTALEVAYYLAMGDSPSPTVTVLPGRSSLPVLNDHSVDACPHAFEGKCHARERRPLGCRVFYCDPNAQHWQGPLTEEYLGRLRSLHERLSVPYFYADWMTILGALNQHYHWSLQPDRGHGQ